MSNPLVHSSAIVDQGAEIGANTKIWHFCHVSSGSKIGDNCSLGQNVFVAPTARLGNNVKVQNNVSIYDQVILEDDVFCGPSCVFTNVVNPRSHISRKSEYQKTHVKRGATIGANSTIVCGVTLGEFCFVAAGAVVTKDVRNYELVSGIPAKFMGWICGCGIRLKEDSSKIRCSVCSKSYCLKNNQLIPD